MVGGHSSSRNRVNVMIARTTRINYSQDLNWSRSCTSVQYLYIRILTVSGIWKKLKILSVVMRELWENIEQNWRLGGWKNSKRFHDYLRRFWIAEFFFINYIRSPIYFSQTDTQTSFDTKKRRGVPSLPLLDYRYLTSSSRHPTAILHFPRNSP